MTDIPDVDLEVMDRDQLIPLLPTAVPASQLVQILGKTPSKFPVKNLVKHNTGIYLQQIPKNHINGLAAFPYDMAEEFNFFKTDILNCPYPYHNIGTMEDLKALLAAPIIWDWFLDKKFVAQLFHFGGIVHKGLSMAEVVGYYSPKSISDIACLVAIKLPGKKYLIGEDWDVIKARIWIKEGGRQFRKSHSVAYALVVGVDARMKAPKFFGL